MGTHVREMVKGRVGGLKSFFEPRSIAVAGVSADPNKMGSIIFWNLIANRDRGLLAARVYALNPVHASVGDQRAYPDVRSLPEIPELLIVAVPESQTAGLIEAAAVAGVRAAIIVTSGYAEAGRGEAEQHIAELASRHGMRILGPNTVGILDTRSGVDSLFLRPSKALPDGGLVASLLRPMAGEVVIITQSGHLGETIVEELASNGVGIRALVGTGNQADVSIEDVIQHFAEDPDTKVITVYMEGLRNGRRFMRVAFQASRKKPVVVFKVGKTKVGARAALTHTASMVGDYDVYRAAFRQSGVVEAETLQELIDYTVSLLMLPRAAGKRLAIVTNAGGVGAIAADEAVRLGLRVDAPADVGINRLRSEFGSAGFISNAALGNPFDFTASSTTSEFVRASELVLSLPDYDIGIVLPTHQAPAMDYDIATRLTEVVRKVGKPVCMCVIGKAELADRIQREFMARGIPSFPTPESAVMALAVSNAQFELRRRAIGPLPTVTRNIPDGKLSPLTRSEIKGLLRSSGIVEPKSMVVRSSEDLEKIQGIRFPVVCKLLSVGLTHKADVGGVTLNVTTITGLELNFRQFRNIAVKKRLPFEGMLVQEMIEGGVELILGGTRDPTFGPVVAAGLGGTYTELARDISLAIAPVTIGYAGWMLTRPNMARVLGGYRGGPRVNLAGLARVISRFSKTMARSTRIEQIEINPLIVAKDGIFAVDARGVASG